MKNKSILAKLSYEQQFEQSATQSLDTKILLMLNQTRLWSHRLKSRKVLANLSSERIQDIGLSGAQVKAEINKPFWK